MVDCSCRPTSSSGAVGAALSVAVTVLDLLLRTPRALAVASIVGCAGVLAGVQPMRILRRDLACKRASITRHSPQARTQCRRSSFGEAVGEYSGVQVSPVGLFADRRLNMEGNMIVDAGATALGRALAVHSELLPLRVCLRSHAQLVLCHCSHSRSTC